MAAAAEGVEVPPEIQGDIGRLHELRVERREVTARVKAESDEIKERVFTWLDTNGLDSVPGHVDIATRTPSAPMSNKLLGQAFDSYRDLQGENEAAREQIEAIQRSVLIMVDALRKKEPERVLNVDTKAKPPPPDRPLRAIKRRRKGGRRAAGDDDDE